MPAGHVPFLPVSMRLGLSLSPAPWPFSLSSLPIFQARWAGLSLDQHVEWAGPLLSGSSSSSSFGSPAHQHSALVAVLRQQVSLGRSHCSGIWCPNHGTQEWLLKWITAHVGNPASRTIMFMLEQMRKKSKCGDFPGGPSIGWDFIFQCRRWCSMPGQRSKILSAIWGGQKNERKTRNRQISE